MNFSDRSTRADYWWVQLWHFLILLIPMITVIGTVTRFFLEFITYTTDYPEDMDMLFFDPTIPSVFTWMMFTFFMIYGLAVFLPDLAITVRRIRDAGFHWAMIFLLLIPSVGGLIIFVFTLLESKDTAENQNLKRL